MIIFWLYAVVYRKFNPIKITCVACIVFLLDTTA